MKLNESQHKVFNDKLIEHFKKTISLFDKYSIEWFACGGTALGAIRHKGIIPWDDDIDIFVKRESYQRLLSLSSEFEKEGLVISSINDKGYNHSFAKILDQNTTILENIIYPISGLWIDVFPLDYYNCGVVGYRKEIEKQRRIYGRYQRGLTNIGIRNYAKAIITFKFNAAFQYLLSSTYYKFTLEKHRQDYINLDKKRQIDNGHNMVSYPEGDIYVYNAEWFSEHVDVPFEDFTIRLPIGWHEYLTLVYGDYLTPPPVNERLVTHNMAYVNLQEGLSKDDVIKRIKKGETLVL